MHNPIKRIIRLMRNCIEIFQSILTYSVDKFCNVWRIGVVVLAPGRKLFAHLETTLKFSFSFFVILIVRGTYGS